MATVRIALDEVVGYFDELEDPRSTINRKHPFVSVVVIALMAVLAGANGPTTIAQWAEYKKKFLRNLLDLPNGVPRKDVFRRVLSLLRPDAFQACFTTWLESLRDKAAEASQVDRPVYVVDGKTARRSHDRKKGLGALHSVSIWGSEYGLSMGQVACDDKSNEIDAIPELLRLVDISGAIITIDAMGTQKEIAAQILNQGGDYVLALKGNQGTLHRSVIQDVDELVDNDFAGVEARHFTTTQTAHGRKETRCYTHLPVPESLRKDSPWRKFRSIGVAITASTRDGKETVEKRYNISSLPVGVKQFARAVRGHWGIENSCHWRLDMTFREDESRIREPAIRENFSWMSRFLLSLPKQHPSKNTVVGRRRACGWDDNFLLEVLVGSRT
jgi:predicted transposase YbfD/YdcC